ncbi:MAG: PH domain-containing protein [Verrucomicrobiales bacterium]|nr:PH domain-containing protein [Verrucomicrobiales bacterium]
MENEETVFPSKIDWWVGLLMALVPFIHLPLGVMVMVKGQVMFGFILIFWGMIVAAIIAALSFPCRYVLSPTTLTIRSGLVTDSFSLSKITGIKKSRTAQASPALSLDRLELSLNDDTKRVISPSRQDEFIAAIEAAIQRNAKADQ